VLATLRTTGDYQQDTQRLDSVILAMCLVRVENEEVKEVGGGLLQVGLGSCSRSLAVLGGSSFVALRVNDCSRRPCVGLFSRCTPSLDLSLLALAGADAAAFVVHVVFDDVGDMSVMPWVPIPFPLVSSISWASGISSHR